MKQPVLEHALLEGERVRLRPLSVDDVDDAFALVHERREVFDWLIWEGPRTRDELVPWYRSWVMKQPSGENYHLAIVDLASGRFCGSIGVRFADHPFEGDVGYWLGSKHWGAGLGTEALRLVGILAFTSLEARALYAQVFEGNAASLRILEKNGYAEDPAARDVVEKQGRRRERRCFRLPRATWEEREADYRPLRVDVRLERRKR